MKKLKLSIAFITIFQVAFGIALCVALSLHVFNVAGLGSSVARVTGRAVAFCTKIIADFLSAFGVNAVVEINAILFMYAVATVILFALVVIFCSGKLRKPIAIFLLVINLFVAGISFWIGLRVDNRYFFGSAFVVLMCVLLFVYVVHLVLRRSQNNRGGAYRRTQAYQGIRVTTGAPNYAAQVIIEGLGYPVSVMKKDIIIRTGPENAQKIARVLHKNGIKILKMQAA